VRTVAPDSNRDSDRALPEVCTGISLEQEIAEELEFAREVTGFDRLLLFASALDKDCLVYICSTRLAPRDLQSMKYGTEIPLANAGAMAAAIRDQFPRVFGGRNALICAHRLASPFAGMAALRSKHFAITPLLGCGVVLGLLAADNKYSRKPLSPIGLRRLPTFSRHLAKSVDHALLERQLQERSTALTESLEQQTATNEILRVINQSQRDVQPVFQAIARNAAKL
jgi:hypothetical protein